MAHVSLELTADAVADAMLEDGVFAEEMWSAIADRLCAGRMLDDLADIIAGMNDRETAGLIAQQIHRAADTAKSNI
ncbi:hypothetical protein [Phaeobacter gallaeciensis]|uniref:hypothetical protein n=1 Tax=Phaeobacter gallaeciensis TaxID=60890 RepID=UPI00237FA0D0|nr:hypothetical protein [Phaeobacter gallaeciensis]MDE4059749.1 hypothetical protein [Phaeobacter gallaeciensis]MDE4122614.1 hypothetical protein [Phaeobacter gallaeciensis]MDE4127236.1 hypothetical protein [Phaeobacter gallaeciensis]